MDSYDNFASKPNPAILGYPEEEHEQYYPPPSSGARQPFQDSKAIQRLIAERRVGVAQPEGDLEVPINDFAQFTTKKSIAVDSNLTGLHLADPNEKVNRETVLLASMLAAATIGEQVHPRHFKSKVKEVVIDGVKGLELKFKPTTRSDDKAAIGDGLIETLKSLWTSSEGKSRNENGVQVLIIAIFTSGSANAEGSLQQLFCSQLSKSLVDTGCTGAQGLISSKSIQSEMEKPDQKARSVKFVLRDLSHRSRSVKGLLKVGK
ncbi:hypothetical protein T439DRAFT_379988 [Meredithblackwellia eburnea MCA 4105]